MNTLYPYSKRTYQFLLTEANNLLWDDNLVLKNHFENWSTGSK